jgi:hypothetical protein
MRESDMTGLTWIPPCESPDDHFEAVSEYLGVDVRPVHEEPKEEPAK